MDTIQGYIEKIKYRNEENGYTVLVLIAEGEEIICVGSFSIISEGEHIKCYGDMIEHNVYGEQFQVKEYEVNLPEDRLAMERYLGSGAIKGIGLAMAKRIADKFKEETFRILEQEPERLAEVKGITEKKAREISQIFNEKRELRQSTMFLQQYGISGTYAVKIFNQYGTNLYDIINTNPYKLAEDIQGIGFKMADALAVKMGIAEDSDLRIKSGILYILSLASAYGHIYLPKPVLFDRVKETLKVLDEQIEKCCMDLLIEKKIVIKQNEEAIHVYAGSFYYMELGIARMLKDLDIQIDVNEGDVLQRIKQIESSTEMCLDEIQRQAVIESAKNGVLVITGGPGTGKTTIINTIIQYFDREGADILLAAPTGRAAKRMSEATGKEAQTIHRLLEISRNQIDIHSKMYFERNENNPLEADVVIIDEMSMVDITIMNSLLKAIAPGTRLIIVGDVNQLPSVGPGNILRDIIHSDSFLVVKLTKIFRQASESDIITNAHKIHGGEYLTLDNKSKDFFYMQRLDKTSVIQTVKQLFQGTLAKYAGCKPLDGIQVLTPMRKSDLGVEKLNQVLQESLNPPNKEKKEREFKQGILREGDKIMQIKNNYQLEWQVRNKFGYAIESGTGIFNGDVGLIKEINQYNETITVLYDDGKEVSYDFNQADEIELAYAVTIHKSQGSEYPVVVLPLLNGPAMLLNRNLLYTGVTRAKKCVVIVGDKHTVMEMIENTKEQERYSSLAERIKEIEAL